MNSDEALERQPLNAENVSQLDKNYNLEKPPPYETVMEEEEKGHVTFKRSQSLPHLSSDRIPGEEFPERMRFFSGASHATLERMRNISTRTFSVVAPDDENQDRGNWSNPIEFFLTCLGYAVGLGNVWRFPFLCYRNGGGAFLIPYTIMLFGCGLPLMFMELALGQYSSEGPLTVWKLAPMFKGLGIGMVLCSCACAVYYNMITGWALYYLFLSIRELLPWSCCTGDWSTEHCISFVTDDTCPGPKHQSAANVSLAVAALWENGSKAKFAADEFFHNHVLGMSDGLHDIGPVQWPLVLSLFVAWAIVFVVLVKGIKTIGKAVYFTSTFPYLVLFILLIRAITEEGAMNGIKFYLTPRWEKLKEAQVWGDAASQIFYSTGVCLGGAITLSSYNRFKNNLYRDAVIVVLGNSLTSIFSGFVVFSILGFMAHSQNTTVDKVATTGPGLTFIAYPQAVTLLPAAPVWSVLFFVMLITLALSTMFPTTENITTSVLDQFHFLRPYKFWVSMAACFAMFLLGLPLTTKGGMYVLQLMDAYGVGYALLLLGLCEVLLVAWRYKAARLLKNIRSMIGFAPCAGWQIVWMVVTPVLLFSSIVFVATELKPINYGTYTFPPWATAVGWLLTCVTISPIPIYAIYKMIRHLRGPGRGQSLLEALDVLTKPDETDWGPALQQFKFADVEAGEDEVFG